MATENSWGNARKGSDWVRGRRHMGVISLPRVSLMTAMSFAVST